ncbi:hypothetical protein KKA85_07845, partial [bacterium]|nr:hypothetical protein [bacterium]
ILDRLGGRGAGRDRRRDKRRGGRERFARGINYLTIRGNEDLFRKLCHDDFDFLLAQRFAAPQEVLRVLLPQSVVGRAQNGHGWFTDEYGSPLVFREATFDRVLTELERTWPEMRGDRVREARSRLVETVRDHVLARLATRTMGLETADGPLLGVDFLRGVEVDTRDFLRGMVLAGFMDDEAHRRMTVAWRGRTFDGDPYLLGGGEIRIVDRERFRLTGIVDPGSAPWDDETLRDLERLGVVMPDRDGAVWSYPLYDQAYFRRRPGDGVCDDLAMIRIGAEHGFDAMLGAFVMDALDTYDKHLARFTSKGSDLALAEAIQEAFRERTDAPLVAGEEILDLIWSAAKNNTPRTTLSSSHRRLIQTESRGRRPTLLHHQRFISGETLDDIKLGFSRVPAREFYGTARSRLLAVGCEVPAPAFRAPARRA